jgi:hypothetical protein
LLYAGTEHGVYVSFDDGDNWQSLSLNLPDTQVPDMVVEENDLVIATHGRSFYVLDDIGVLRQITPEVARASVHLFQPRDAVRSVKQASFEYFLKSPAEKVMLEVLNGNGEVVRSFTGTREQEREEPEGREPAEGQGRRFGQGEARTRMTGAGVTRFAWDLRYQNHSTFPGMILWSASNQGPAAPPGEYQVRLKVGDYTETRKFTVRMDPRLMGVTQADLQAQFELAMKIRNKTSEANDAVALIREIKKQGRERASKSNNSRIASGVESLLKKLSEIEEEIYQVRNQSNQDPLNFPIKLNNRLASLRRSVETGDARPTSGAYGVFAELSEELGVQLEKLSSLLKNDLAVLNKLLDQEKIELILIETKRPQTSGTT